MVKICQRFFGSLGSFLYNKCNREVQACLLNKFQYKNFVIIRLLTMSYEDTGNLLHIHYSENTMYYCFYFTLHISDTVNTHLHSHSPTPTLIHSLWHTETQKNFRCYALFLIFILLTFFFCINDFSSYPSYPLLLLQSLF